MLTKFKAKYLNLNNTMGRECPHIWSQSDADKLKSVRLNGEFSEKGM